MAGHSTQGLTQSERVLQGTFADVQDYLQQLRQQNWPLMRLYTYDMARTALAGELPIAVPEREARSRAVAQEAAAQLPQGFFDPRFDITEAASQLRMFNQGKNIYQPSDSLDYRLANAWQGELPVTGGVAAAFNARGRYTNGEGASNVYTIGLHAGVCSHCAKATQEILPARCEEVDPDRARMEQFARLATGLHEFAHVADQFRGDTVYKGYTDPETRPNYGLIKESLADSFTALMLARDYGAEGKAFIQRFAPARTSLDGSDEHFTLPVLRASLQWAQDNAAELAKLTPTQIMDRAAELTFQNAPSWRASQTIMEHKRGVKATAGPYGINWLEALPQLSSPEASAVRAAVTNDPAVKLFEESLQWAGQQATLGKATMQAANPLNNPAWRAIEAARVQSCKVEEAPVDTSALPKVREGLVETPVAGDGAKSEPRSRPAPPVSPS